MRGPEIGPDVVVVECDEWCRCDCRDNYWDHPKTFPANGNHARNHTKLSFECCYWCCRCGWRWMDWLMDGESRRRGVPTPNPWPVEEEVPVHRADCLGCHHCEPSMPHDPVRIPKRVHATIAMVRNESWWTEGVHAMRSVVLGAWPPIHHCWFVPNHDVDEKEDLLLHCYWNSHRLSWTNFFSPVLSRQIWCDRFHHHHHHSRLLVSHREEWQSD